MLEKELEDIVLKEKDIIPFLKKLSPEDKKMLVPFLKKFGKKIFKYYDVVEKKESGIHYYSVPKYSEAKRNIISKACYVCFEKTDAKNTFFNVNELSISDDYIDNIIPWYTPKWYSDLINENIPWELDYEKVMALYKKGLLYPSPALISAKLPRAIIEKKRANNRYSFFYKPEALLKHKETLEKHIWFLFEEESDIHNIHNHYRFENYEEDNDVWINTITNFATENKIDRKKVLAATIYSSTKGFNKNLSGWFFNLLIELNPTQDEFLSLQNEFFAALNSPHSKVVNTVLNYFKLVANQQTFKYEVFIENASTLLNAETKSVVNSTLMILDKIAKTHRSSSISVCKKVAEALINVDEKLQLRAAKIIEKYGGTDKKELLDEVSPYADSLFHSPQEILKEYIAPRKEVESHDLEAKEIKLLSDNNKLHTYETLDDLIFFVSQAIDNNEVYHIDLLLSYLPKLNVLLNKENVVRLKPIFKRSLDLSRNSQIGNLEREAARYINDFAEILIKKYPSELATFKKAKTQKIKRLKGDGYYSYLHKNNLKEIDDQSIPDYIYHIHHLLFIKSKSLIKKGLTLELLSTPTHAPCWIAPKVLIDRIVSYEKSNEQILLYDFQVAIGRLPINEQVTDVIEHIDKIKNSDIKKALSYHFDLLDIQSVDISRPELWLQSVLSKNRDVEIKYFQEHLANPLQKEMGTYHWSCELRDFLYMEYDHAVGKQVQKKMIRKELKFKDFDLQKTEPESLITSIKGAFNKKKKTTNVTSIYEYMSFKKQKDFTTIQSNDDVKFLFLSPNNPSMFLNHVIYHNLKESNFFDENSKKNMINLLTGLYAIWYRPDFKESTYLFLAIGFLCGDKVARELAAEIWIKTNSEKKINNKLLGQILGKLESGEYAPLKRFTDLLTTSLFNVSKKHNESLFNLLDYMIGNMNNTPIRGVKKMLEIFLELKLNFPQININESTMVKLLEWKEAKALKPLISKFENN